MNQSVSLWDLLEELRQMNEALDAMTKAYLAVATENAALKAKLEEHALLDPL